MTKVWKIAVAVIVVAVVVLLFMPYVRDFVDLLGSDKDGTDSTVSTLIEWLLGGLLAFLIYSGIVAVPGLVARLRQRATPHQ
jgi:RsiW-degrading membrane proteinase PrsW (M82 family)